MSATYDRPGAATPSFIDRHFAVTERGSTIGREILAGATTFAAMAYIVAVNPIIMSGAGMDRAQLVMATALAAIFGSITMGLLANLPLGVAPAMGSNAIFAGVLVKQLGVPWPAALAVVAITGVLFLILSLSKLRERIAQDVPEVLKIGIQASVGALIVLIALKTAGFVVVTPAGLSMARLDQPPVVLTLVGLLLTPILIVRRVPGALILSIAILTVAGIFVPAAAGKYVTTMPSSLVAWPTWPSQTFLAFDFRYIADHFFLVLPFLFYFFCGEFFSTLGTLIGVTGAANLRRPDGSIPNATGAFATDALSSIVGPCLGTSVVTAFIESVTGVQAGGRTGLTALVVAFGFILSLFLGPLLVAIPAQATVPALFIVGVLMLQGLARTNLALLENAIPIGSMFMLTVLTGNLVNGMAVGTLAYILIQLAEGRSRQVKGVVWLLAVVFIAYLYNTTRT